jgi:hypothetical protein
MRRNETSNSRKCQASKNDWRGVRVADANQMISISFYCGINEQNWNHYPVMPGRLACIAPVYGRTARTRRENRITVPSSTKIMQDSGAFSDGPNDRLTFAQALVRQVRHAQKFGYVDQVTHVASYDLLIDERWQNGARFKERWNVDEAMVAVNETIVSAKWLSSRRGIVERRFPALEGLILSAQGVTPRQYLECAERIIPLFKPGDVLGLGGWCIVGKLPKQLLPVLIDTMRLVVPAAAKAGIQRVHIWGVIFPRALAWVSSLCHAHGIHLSTDSAGPQLKPAFGEWGYGDWRNKAYQRQPVAYRGLHRIKHVRMTRRWLAQFEPERYLKPHQLALL